MYVATPALIGHNDQPHTAGPPLTPDSISRVMEDIRETLISIEGNLYNILQRPSPTLETATTNKLDNGCSSGMLGRAAEARNVAARCSMLVSEIDVRL